MRLVLLLGVEKTFLHGVVWSGRDQDRLQQCMLSYITEPYDRDGDTNIASYVLTIVVWGVLTCTVGVGSWEIHRFGAPEQGQTLTGKLCR